MLLLELPQDLGHNKGIRAHGFLEMRHTLNYNCFLYHSSLSLTLSIFQFQTEMPPRRNNRRTKHQAESSPTQPAIAPPPLADTMSFFSRCSEHC